MEFSTGIDRILISLLLSIGFLSFSPTTAYAACPPGSTPATCIESTTGDTLVPEDTISSDFANKNNPGSFGQAFANDLIVERTGVKQEEFEQDGTDNKDSGGGSALSLGADLIKKGIDMIIKGLSLNSSSRCGCAGNPLIAAGKFFKAGGAGANNAGNSMLADARVGDGFGDNLSQLTLASTSVNVNGLNDAGGVGGFSPGAASSSVGVPGGVVGSAAAAGVQAASSIAALTVDEARLNSGTLGKAFDDLEKKFGVDRKELASALLKEGDDLGATLEKFGVVEDGDAFNTTISEVDLEKENLAELAKTAGVEVPDGLNTGGASGESTAGAEGVAGADGAGTVELGPDGKPIEKKAFSFADIVAGINKGGDGKKDGLSAKELLGLTGKKNALARTKNGANNDGVSGSKLYDGVAGAESGRAIASSGFYSEKTIFQRVHQHYQARMHKMLGTDFYINQMKIHEKDRTGGS